MHFSNPKNIVRICYASLISVFIILILDNFAVNYWIKAAIKLIVWGSAVAWAGRPKFYTVLIFRKNKSLLWISMLGFCVLGLILTLTPVFLPMFNLELAQGHMAAIGVATDYLMVSVYIVFVNATLEELFFRGLCTIILEENSNRTFAVLYSSSLFAIYHIPMMSQFFPAFLVILCFILLFCGGIILAMLNDRTKNIYNSWIVHAFANVALQFFGYLMISS
jgi:membrane protease YdiL (CAAX protease family)